MIGLAAATLLLASGAARAPEARARSGKGARVERSSIPDPPELPRHKSRACRKDADCVFLPSICPGCNPCTPTWRSVGNRREAKRLRGMRARVRCARLRCRTCAHWKNWLGTRAVCFSGQCRVAPLPPTKGPILADLTCKRDRDCGFWPASHCGCPQCGLFWRLVGNRQSLKRERQRRARLGACATRRCKPCARRALGTKAVCVRRRCTAR